MLRISVTMPESGLTASVRPKGFLTPQQAAQLVSLQTRSRGVGALQASCGGALPRLLVNAHIAQDTAGAEHDAQGPSLATRDQPIFT